MSKSKKHKRKESAKPTGKATTKAIPEYKGKLSLVIPCYNESERVNLLVGALQNFERKWRGSYEVIIVDDGSSDDTLEKIKAAINNKLSNPDLVQVIPLEKNAGKGNALSKGVAAASGDAILTLDADMATDPLELGNWLRQLPNNTFPDNEILIGSREHKDSKVKGEPMRRVMGVVFNFFIQLFTSLTHKDTQCGFKLYPAKIAKELFAGLRVKGWAHDVELLYKADLASIPVRSMSITWKDVAGTKISPLKDSFKMFFQALFISFFVKWEWFVKKPLASVFGKKETKHAGGKTEHPIFRFLFVFLAAFLLILMPSISSDYGVTGDEHTQRVYGDKLLKHKVTDGEDESYLQWKNLKYYGGLFDYMTSRLNPPADPNSPYRVDAQGKAHPEHEEPGFQAPNRRFGDIYDFRHLINSLIGFLMILFAGLLAKEVTGSWRVAFLTLLFLALSPRIFGHSMNNPKDIPFAAAFIFTLYYIFKFVKQLPNPGKKSIALLAVGIAAAINVRVGGLLLIAYLGLFTGVAYLWKPELRAKLKDVKHLAKIAGIGLLISVLGYLGGQIFWPWARQAPFSNPLVALGEMESFDTAIQILFEGKRIWSDVVPWYYIPKWMAIGSPIFFLIGLVLAVVLFVILRKSISTLVFALMLFAGVFPIAYAVAKESSLYDGMRHFLFVYPIFAVVAAWGWSMLVDVFKTNKIGKYAVGLVLAGLLALPAIFMVKNHPYQYVYFNEIFGGVDKAYANYETDYWMTSMKGLTDWFIENVPEAKQGWEMVQAGKSPEEIKAQLPQLIVASNCGEPVVHYLQRRIPNLKVYYVRYHDREERPWEYGFWYSRHLDKSYIENAWPPADIIYEEKIGNTTIGAVTKRKGNHTHLGYKAKKAKNYEEAIGHYQTAVQLDSKNEGAWVSLAECYRAIGDHPKTKEAIDKSLAINPEHTTSLGILGSYYVSTGDMNNAKASFEKAIATNYKYNFAYFWLAQLNAQSNPRKALEYIELHDKHDGNIPSAYDLGIQLAKQQGKRAAGFYFEAKKAYRGGDGQTALQKNKQALQADPNYGPAVKLQEVFDVLLAQQKK